MIRLAVAAMVFVSFAGAQDVPPPPKPDALGPSLAPLLESLKQTLLASGRVESGRNWQQITSVVVDARGCQARVHYDFSYNGNNPTDRTTSLFFESIDTVAALTQTTLVINGNISSLRFASVAEASKAAEGVDAAQQA